MQDFTLTDNFPLDLGPEIWPYFLLYMKNFEPIPKKERNEREYRKHGPRYRDKKDKYPLDVTRLIEDSDGDSTEEQSSNGNDNNNRP